jgi:predicted nucleotidyltransferase
MLAEEYYTNKNYSESNKWALIANHIDADNEKSWLWFAKSKVKLGQKEDAIVALKAFLKNNKSQAAQTLLNKINLGELNE